MDSSPLLYVWTAGGTMASLSFPGDLAPPTETPVVQPVEQKKTPQKIPEYAIEPFIDNLRRTVSSVNQYSEIPFSNEVSTRQERETIPVFKFILQPNRVYKLNVLIRAKVNYKYTVPVLAKYRIETNSPGSIMNYRATYVSSNEVNTGSEKNSNVLGSVLSMVVDSNLSLIRLTATFQTNTLTPPSGVELRVHHGLKTDDPEATLYGMDGSYAILSEMTDI